ncbi:hypothetical protein I79_010209 [Cricetulus griseus]|uniref:Uncharacterized protein n=1 Tax=Cricetulus griseus TaxID=10029 RepID=G3HHU9_CRIGR|nr:hypothetical protein I79_010209 [Cricetulus griseus]
MRGARSVGQGLCGQVFRQNPVPSSSQENPCPNSSASSLGAGDNRPLLTSGQLPRHS